MTTYLRPRVWESGGVARKDAEGSACFSNRNAEEAARGVIRPQRRGRGLWSQH